MKDAYEFTDTFLDAWWDDIPGNCEKDMGDSLRALIQDAQADAYRAGAEAMRKAAAKQCDTSAGNAECDMEGADRDDFLEAVGANRMAELLAKWIREIPTPSARLSAEDA